MKYIHWGSSRFDPKRFAPVTNFEIMNKPSGGLWASPADAKYSWFEWSMGNDFYTNRLKTSFVFEISPDARVLELTPDNVWDLPLQKNGEQWIIPRSRENTYGMVMGVDFEALAQDYDVLECSITKYPSLYWSLYGWDCDCILVMNPNVIVEETE